MKRILAIVALVAVLPSCKVGMLSADLIDGSLRGIADRHDAYVQVDPGLTDLERKVFLRDTEIVRRILDEVKQR